MAPSTPVVAARPRKPRPSKKKIPREGLRVFASRSAPVSAELERAIGTCFFAGFHDGDGNVDAANVIIRFDQSASNRWILELLVEEFGGKIADKKVSGNDAPKLQWRMRVDESIKYARAILPHVLQSRKRRELENLAEYREKNTTRKEFEAAILDLRKVPDDEIDETDVLARMTVDQVDAYFAGFFFADGCARFVGKTGTCLSLSQREGNRAILRFAERFYGCGTISGSDWNVYGVASRELAALFLPYR